MMKIHSLLALCVITLYSLQATAQKLYKDQPLLLAQGKKADICIANKWYTNEWNISPQIAHDSLKLQLYSSSENFAFRTDKDSIRFNIKPGETKSFYVQLPNAEPAHTVITATPYRWDMISYDKKDKQPAIQLFYEKAPTSYFDSLIRAYPIDAVLKNDHTDMEKVLSILNWTHHQWKHDGGNSPKGNSGLAILNEAHAGGRFPCFAYAIVLRDQLITQGFKARTLYLKTKDAETRKSSPGHVATEVYLADIKKWVFIDGQFNVMPTLKGKPLNAVEFQKALSTNYDQLVLASKDQVSKKEYTDFVYDYLYYFNTALDNRPLPAAQQFKVEGKTSVMLVPLGAPNLTKMSFFKSEINYCVYTHSLKDFYAVPQ